MRRAFVALGLVAGLSGAAGAFDFEPVKPLDVKVVDPSMVADVYGAYEIRDKSGKKRCRVTLLKEPGIGGSQIDIAPGCDKAFPIMAESPPGGCWKAGPSIWSIPCARRACASKRRTIAMFRSATPRTLPAWMNYLN